ncbi:MAG: dephospho-CoA kinase [Treponema sp.]|nr:dephospho-CoA kinase [Treponema sp.]
MILCVTGPMAAGKNAVSSILEQKGFVSTDADTLTHQAIQELSPVIIQTFAHDAQEKHIALQNSDGSLNRRALGALIFSNPVLLKKQEDLVYPKVIELITHFIAHHKNSDIIINATVLYKIPSLLALCTMVLYVDAPVVQRFIRAKKRDGMPCSHIIARFLSQRNLFAKYSILHADIKRVWNIGNRKILEQKIDKFLRTCR